MDNDLYKEKISWYKLLFTITTTALAACIGWLVANIDFKYRAVVLLNVIAIIIISMTMVIAAYKIRHYLNKLEED